MAAGATVQAFDPEGMHEASKLLDGVVFKVNRIDEQRRLGVNAHHPRFAIAYKFQGDSGQSVLRDLGSQFVWTTTWISLSFWLCMGLVGGLAFQRWVAPGVRAALSGTNTAAPGAMNPVD